MAKTKNEGPPCGEVISSNVADSIKFCQKSRQRREFSQSDGTVNVLKTFDAIFDLLNSRNPCGKGQKAPMKSTNKEQWKYVIETGKKYILGLKDKQGYRLVDSKRKTGFVGFLACLESVSNIFHQYVEQDLSLKYLLTYKLSQDHLELFFSTIRARVDSTTTRPPLSSRLPTNGCLCVTM